MNEEEQIQDIFSSLERTMKRWVEQNGELGETLKPVYYSGLLAGAAVVSRGGTISTDGSSDLTLIQKLTRKDFERAMGAFDTARVCGTREESLVAAFRALGLRFES